MKTFLKIFIPLLLVGGASWYIYEENFGGEDYYTQITTSGTKEESKYDTGEKLTRYNYTQKAYNQKGKEKTEKLSEAREKPLRMNAYLKLKVNKNKGVLSWVEVKEKEVPAAALEKIKQTAEK
ncbi:YxeA family protein [Enterococcus faecalis]